MTPSEVLRGLVPALAAKLRDDMVCVDRVFREPAHAACASTPSHLVMVLSTSLLYIAEYLDCGDQFSELPVDEFAFLVAYIGSQAASNQPVQMSASGVTSGER